MNDWKTWWSQAPIVFGVAGVVLILLYWLGMLKPSRLDEGPKRPMKHMPIAWAALVMFAMSIWPFPTKAPMAGLAMLLGVLLGVAWVLLSTWHDSKGLRTLGLIPARPWRESLAGLLGLVVAMPLVSAATMLMAGLAMLIGQETPSVGHEALREMQNTNAPDRLAMLILGAVVVAPILEEILFRGVVQTGLGRLLGWKKRWRIVLIASLLFAMTHTDVALWQTIPALAVLGFVLGYLYERHGSLLPCILAHAGFNAFNIALVLFVVDS